MNGPINYIIFELGEMQQRGEYKAETSRYWGQNIENQDRLGRSKGRKLALVLGGVGAAVVLFIQLLPL